MSSQPTLFDHAAGEHGLCRYGYPDNVGRCVRVATHRAAWRRVIDGMEQSGGLECCRDHADYYATAWVPFALKVGARGGTPRDEAAWIDILD